MLGDFPADNVNYTMILQEPGVSVYISRLVFLGIALCTGPFGLCQQTRRIFLHAFGHDVGLDERLPEGPGGMKTTRVQQ